MEKVGIVLLIKKINDELQRASNDSSFFVFSSVTEFDWDEAYDVSDLNLNSDSVIKKSARYGEEYVLSIFKSFGGLRF